MKGDLIRLVLAGLIGLSALLMLVSCSGGGKDQTSTPPSGAVQFCDENPDHVWCKEASDGTEGRD